MKNTQGRISIKRRQTLVAPATALAKAQNLAINQVMSAVLWKGERMPNRISPKALTGIVTTETVGEHQAELARRAAACQTQIAGMVKSALPTNRRNPENVGAVLQAIGETASRSITQIQAQIRAAVSRLNLGDNGETGATG